MLVSAGNTPAAAHLSSEVGKRAALAQLREEVSEEHNRVELQTAVMEEMVARVRANCEERVQRAPPFFLNKKENSTYFVSGSLCVASERAHPGDDTGGETLHNKV